MDIRSRSVQVNEPVYLRPIDRAEQVSYKQHADARHHSPQLGEYGSRFGDVVDDTVGNQSPKVAVPKWQPLGIHSFTNDAVLKPGPADVDRSDREHLFRQV